MNISLLAWFFLIAAIPSILPIERNHVDEDTGYDDDEDELSLMEYILLFPLSVTDTTRTPVDMHEETEQMGLATQLLTASTDWFFRAKPNTWAWLCLGWLAEVKSAAVSWLFDHSSGMNRLYELASGQVSRGVECAHASMVAVLDSVDAITQTAVDFPACFADLKERCCSIPDLPFLRTALSTLGPAVDAALTNIQTGWLQLSKVPPLTTTTTTDVLRYLVVFLLVVSMIPLFRHRDSSNKEKRSAESKRPRSKLELETQVDQSKSSSFTKYVNRALSPVLETSSETTSPKKRVKRSPVLRPLRTSPQSHYLMCENFDLKPCNCGGRVSPLFNFQKGSPVTANPLKTCTQAVREELKLKRSPPPLQMGTSGRNKISAKTDPEATSKCEQKLSRNQIVREFRGCDEMIKRDNDILGDGVATIPMQHPNLKATIELFENDAGDNDLDLSIASDIGEPCFNSSFKEETLYIIQDAVERCAIGDGPNLHGPTIVTKRSPSKQLGMSFDEDVDTEEDSFSFLDKSFEEDSGMVFDEDDDSLLDSSVLNRSMSYDSGHGILELAVVIMVQSVYRWTKRYLRERKRLKRSSKWADTVDVVKTCLGNTSRHGAQQNVSRNAVESDIDPCSICDDASESSDFESFLNSFGDKKDDVGMTKQDSAAEMPSGHETVLPVDGMEESLPFVYDNSGSRQLIHFSDDVAEEAAEQNVDQLVNISDMNVEGTEINKSCTDEKTDGTEVSKSQWKELYNNQILGHSPGSTNDCNPGITHRHVEKTGISQENDGIRAADEAD